MRKNKVFWFSGSGNSLALAKEIAKSLGESDLIRMTTKNFNYKLEEDFEDVYFIFPIHAWRPPRLVVDFVETMNFSNAKNIYAFATSGGAISDSFYYFDKILGKKGLSLSLAKSIKMPDNCIYLYNPPLDSPKNKEIIDNVDLYLSSSLDLSATQPPYQRASKISAMFLTGLVGSFFYKSLKNFDKKFFATDACTSCGICTRICPSYNILLDENRRPNWKGTCTACMACVHLCPEKAINYTNKTMKRSRYICPSVKIKEFLL
ncbi:MAG: EFR1 family ferrodoxin [Spirochaetales bacterium]|nr:EFR1 family ferrodoxin [Spirochaetales bacterium]